MNLEKEIFDISLQDIIPNRFQPREIFNDTELNELSESIKQHGVIQPIIVRKVGDKYEIIAGERRFRASQMAGKPTIPALVRDIDDKEAAKIALLENLQRSNLTPIEEAKTYQTILKIDNITQDELANNLGRSQSTIANKLRLLTLNEEVQTALLNSQISERHARSLLGLSNEQQVELLHKTLAEKLTVRQLDEEVMRITGKVPEAMNNDVINYNPEPEMTPSYQPQNASIETNNNIVQENNVSIPTIDIPQEVQNEPIVEETNNQTEVFQPLNPVIEPAETNIVQENMPEETQLEQPVEIPIVPNIENTNLEPEVNPISENNDLNQNEPEIPENKSENIFDKLRINREDIDLENKFDLKTPDINQAISIPSEEDNKPEIYNDIYDLRFAINNFRQAVQNTEKFGFKVNTTENDIGDKYQIIIEIDKKQ